MNQEECICALATPAGGAIGIIRLSGSDAITLTDKIFQSANGKSLEEAKPYTLHYGEIKDKDGNTIDDVLVSVFRAPPQLYRRELHRDFLSWQPIHSSAGSPSLYRGRMSPGRTGRIHPSCISQRQDGPLSGRSRS